MSQFTPSDFGDEIRATKIEANIEPLLPIEKKLIGFSLGIGLFLLAVLAVANHFFPAAS